MTYIYCTEAECVYNNGYAQCSNVNPILNCEDTDAISPRFNCGSYVCHDALMEGTDW